VRELTPFYTAKLRWSKSTRPIAKGHSVMTDTEDSTDTSTNLDIASIYKELDTAERTADALEGKLTSLERRLDELLGQLDTLEKEKAVSESKA
jgi:chromosome segregation ATPase